MAEQMMPILFGYRFKDEIRELRAAGCDRIIIAIPWRVIAPHEKQAQRNHSQSLSRLAERGGLGLCEAVAILEDRSWRQMSLADANRRLIELIEAAKGT